MLLPLVQFVVAALDNADACLGGYYWSHTLHDCLPCAAGKYSITSSKADSCKLCPPGRYGKGASKSNQCSGACIAGKYSVYGSKSKIDCEQCPAGYFSSHIASRSCTMCPKGLWTASTSNIKCQNAQGKHRIAPKHCPYVKFSGLKPDHPLYGCMGIYQAQPKFEDVDSKRLFKFDNPKQCGKKAGPVYLFFHSGKNQKLWSVGRTVASPPFILGNNDFKATYPNRLTSPWMMYGAEHNTTMLPALDAQCVDSTVPPTVAPTPVPKPKAKGMTVRPTPVAAASSSPSSAEVVDPSTFCGIVKFTGFKDHDLPGASCMGHYGFYKVCAHAQ